MRYRFLSGLTLLSTACAAPAAAGVALTPFASGFGQAVATTGVGNDLFVADHNGNISAVDRTTKAVTPVFAVPGLLTGGEDGLLGFAMDPNYATNGRFYAYGTTCAGGSDTTEACAGGKYVSQLTRYTNNAVAKAATPEASSVILQIDQPFPYHKGGWVAFGPDGDLYLASGDGGYDPAKGSFGNHPNNVDVNNNAQNKDSLLGKILRIDVNAAIDAPGKNYAVPASNPFGNEVFAYGLRNPYRDSFDRATGDLYLGDVGENTYEEIDKIAAGTSGQNFGWRALEGNIPTPGVGDPLPAGVTAPLLAYAHDGHGAAVIGGYVYRGNKIASLEGRYVYGDFTSGHLWSMKLDGTDVQDLLDGPSPVGAYRLSSFGEDSDGNLYVTRLDSVNSVYLLTGTGADAVTEPATWALLMTGFGITGAAIRSRRKRTPVVTS